MEQEEKETGLLLPVGLAIGGLVIGIFLGAGFSGGSGDLEDKLEEGLARIEGRFESMSGFQARLDELSETAKSLGDRIESVAGGSGDLAKKVDDYSAAVNDQLAAAGNSITELAGKMDSAVAGLHGKMDDAMSHIGGKIESLSKSATTAAGSAVTQPAASDASAAAVAAGLKEEDDLAEEIGDSGLILSVGQTGTVNDQKLFLSRLAADGAHFLIVGKGNGITGIHRALSLDNGCSVKLAGVAEGKGYFSTSCP